MYICLYDFTVFITWTFLAYITSVSSEVALMNRTMLLLNINNLSHINFSIILQLLKLVVIFSSCYTHTHTHLMLIRLYILPEQALCLLFFLHRIISFLSLLLIFSTSFIIDKHEISEDERINKQMNQGMNAQMFLDSVQFSHSVVSDSL